MTTFCICFLIPIVLVIAILAFYIFSLKKDSLKVIIPLALLILVFSIPAFIHCCKCLNDQDETYRISNIVIQEIDSNDDIAERDVEKLIINIVKEKEN